MVEVGFALVYMFLLAELEAEMIGIVLTDALLQYRAWLTWLNTKFWYQSLMLGLARLLQKGGHTRPDCRGREHFKL